MKVPETEIDLEEMFLDQDHYDQSQVINPKNPYGNGQFKRRIAQKKKGKIVKHKYYDLPEMPQKLSKRLNTLKRQIKFRERKLKELSHNCRHIAITEKIEKKYGIDMTLLCQALKAVDEYQFFEYEDQKFFFQNLIRFLANGTIDPGSLTFAKLCTQVRMYTDNNNIQTLPGAKKFIVSFDEKDVVISKKEYDLCINFNAKEEVYRAILGIPHEEDMSTKPISEKLKYYGKKMLDYQIFLNSSNSFLFDNKKNDLSHETTMNNVTTMNNDYPNLTNQPLMIKYTPVVKSLYLKGEFNNVNLCFPY